MKLSIITVNLNNREGLQKTIDSVICQTFRDFEWIVIDGGSTDGSKELIEQYSDHFAYWVSEPDKGIYNAMNKGIKVAKGEYLQFLNSGDWLYCKTTLERCLSHNFEEEIIYGDLCFCNGDISEIYRYPQQLSLRFLYNLSLGHPASFIKKSILQKTLYDENLKIVSDWKLFFTQAMNNVSFGHIDEVVCCFDTTGISSADEKLVEKERASVLNEYLNPMIRTDYEAMNEIEERLCLPQVKRVLEYGGKKKLYHKMITACLKCIELLDNISWKRVKSQS